MSTIRTYPRHNQKNPYRIGKTVRGLDINGFVGEILDDADLDIGFLWVEWKPTDSKPFTSSIHIDQIKAE